MANLLYARVLSTLKARGWVLERRGEQLLYQPEASGLVAELCSYETMAREIVTDALANGGEMLFLAEGGAA